MLQKGFKETLQDTERNINIAREWMNCGGNQGHEILSNANLVEMQE